MNKLKNKIYLIPVFAFFIFYLVWLFRAYSDVAYMDQIQVLAGNINHMYNHDATLHDYYYRPPFLLFISIFLVFINCKLFSYNTFYECFTSGVILFLIAYYLIKSNISFFNGIKEKFYFSLLVALIVFCFAKWEMSLWGGGFSHYMVVLFGIICVGTSHKYYLNDKNDRFSNKFFIPLYVGLSMVSILETTSYFLPFQLSILILLLINYKVFHDRIFLKRWKIVLSTTIGLIVLAFLINYLSELYSISHPYGPYGKTNLSQSLGASFKKIFTEPIFVTKFFLIANAGDLIDKDSYSRSSFVNNSMPYLGLIVLLFYFYAVFTFIKRKKVEGIFSISLIISTVIFCVTVLMGRLSFGDVYYGASSRYSAETFLGILGLCIFFQLLLGQETNISNYRKLLYKFPIALVVVSSLIINKNQWYIAPYRKANFLQMAYNYKKNDHLESLMGYNNQITAEARKFLVRNKLNVFKPQLKLGDFTVNCDQLDKNASGFYDLESDQYGVLRWTNGNGVVLLPNLYTIKDTIRAKLIGYPPQSDTPRVVLNDNIVPCHVNHFDGGYEYTFAFQEQEVLFKMSIQNKSIVPHVLNKDNPDNRTLGLIFRSVTLHE